MPFPAEPFRIKVVEPVKLISREEREQVLRDAGYNLFSVPAEKIYIDLLTDSGTSAMSDYQWAGMMMGDESYAQCRNFFHFEQRVQEITGYKHVIPTHQGRVAENLLFSTVVRAGKTVINNTHFDTTRANVQANGGQALDLVQEKGKDPSIVEPFKGDMDVEMLEAEIKRIGVENIPLVMLTVTNNSGGGQPVSMQNVRAVSEVCKRYGLPLFFDACRFAENCWFIKQRDPEFADRSVLSIAQELFSYGDGCTMSAKKDALVNMGGFLALNDESLADKLRDRLILIEGFLTYGGLAGRDLEAVARGLEDVMNEDYLAYRTGQIAAIGEMLEASGIPFVKPTGGHALFLDAKSFLPHIPQEQFPGQSLNCELYREVGVRAVEIGSLMFAEPHPDTGVIVTPPMELVRLAIPRRVYTESHLRYVVEGITRIYERRDTLKGMRITWAPKALRHFRAHLEYVD